jgi:tRNA threonylcarbamoyladenosine biosynthesis protein TsaE
MIKSIDEIEEVVLKIKKLLPDGGIVLLKGDLASGKTTLVKAFVKMLGISEEATSPTFSIMNIYDDKIYHYDIYNEGVAKFLESGLLENLEKEGYHFIEWADEKLEKILEAYGFDFITVEIIPEGEKRRYRIR